jgi:hypothetical protein
MPQIITVFLSDSYKNQQMHYVEKRRNDTVKYGGKYRNCLALKGQYMPYCHMQFTSLFK